MSAVESSLLRNAGFRHGFSIKPWDFAARATPEEDEAIALLLKLPSARILRVAQEHGATVVLADARYTTERADAIVTKERGLPVGVRTADCVPILLADTRTGAVAAVHAGWRGVVGGVIASACALHAFDTAAIGPCIGACCFEIGEDVAQKLAPFVREGPTRARGDLRAAVRAQLLAAGLHANRVDDVPGCTKCEGDRFFSHRRDGASAGRHLAVIAAP